MENNYKKESEIEEEMIEYLEKYIVEYRVELLKEALGEEEMLKMNDMTQSEMEEVIKMVINSEEVMKEKRESRNGEQKERGYD